MMSVTGEGTVAVLRQTGDVINTQSNANGRDGQGRSLGKLKLKPGKLCSTRIAV